MASKKMKRALKVGLGLGAAYLGSKMLGNKGLDKIDTDALSNDMPSPKSKATIMPEPKPTAVARPRKFMGMNFGVSTEPSNKAAFLKAEAERKLKTGFGRNVGKRSIDSSALDFDFSGGAKTGKFVTSKCKLGKNKKTKLY